MKLTSGLYNFNHAKRNITKYLLVLSAVVATVAALLYAPNAFAENEGIILDAAYEVYAEEKPEEKSEEKTEEKPVEQTVKTAPNYLRLINWDNPYTGDDYTLVKLSTVIEKGVVSMNSGHLIETRAGAYANLMFKEAHSLGLKLVIDNTYRSVASQTRSWARRVNSMKNKGNDPYNYPVSVMPGGKSEHATGLAMDIVSRSHRSKSSAFSKTKEGIWLKENAHRFGFILRYPKDKTHITGVIFEPWHFRFVGIDAATEMYNGQYCLEEYIEYLNSKPNTGLKRMY